MARLSGLQREALSLYRKCLREIRKKPAVRSPTTIARVDSELNANLVQDSRDNFKHYARYVSYVDIEPPFPDGTQDLLERLRQLALAGQSSKNTSR